MSVHEGTPGRAHTGQGCVSFPLPRGPHGRDRGCAIWLRAEVGSPTLGCARGIARGDVWKLGRIGARSWPCAVRRRLCAAVCHHGRVHAPPCGCCHAPPSAAGMLAADRQSYGSHVPCTVPCTVGFSRKTALLRVDRRHRKARSARADSLSRSPSARSARGSSTR